MKRTLNLSRRVMLHIFLGGTAIGWGVCIAGIFASAPVALDLLAYVGGGIDPSPLMTDPMYDYWLRMASSVFAFIGIGYLFLAIWPRKFVLILPFSGVFMLVEGIILLVHGLRLGLPPVPFWGDTAFCFIGGIGILFCMGSVKEEPNSRE